MTLPPVEELRRLLEYDPDTGIFTRRMRKRAEFKSDLSYHCWLARYANRPITSVAGSHGYYEISISKKRYLAHRVAWAMHYGEWPASILDHKDRDPKNNRIANLRLATTTLNLANRRVRRDSLSGVKGVARTRSGKWSANISVNGKMCWIGCFPTKESAGAAYRQKARELYGEFAA